jgi:hypothetical protein
MKRQSIWRLKRRLRSAFGLEPIDSFFGQPVSEFMACLPDVVRVPRA